MSNEVPRLDPGASSQGLNEIDRKQETYKGNKMKYNQNDFCEITIIRLQTELENALGHREHYIRQQDFNRVTLWDQEVENILHEINNFNHGVRYE